MKMIIWSIIVALNMTDASDPKPGHAESRRWCEAQLQATSSQALVVFGPDQVHTNMCLLSI